jgi:translation initiation factor 2B subunit (eIF-2B alpha/beta/delta family)
MESTQNHSNDASAASIATDTEHGAAYLSIRALEILRDRARALLQDAATSEVGWESLRHLARQLLAARPTMSVLQNRINRVMHASREAGTAEAVVQESRRVIEWATKADEEAARRAAGYIAGRRVFTLSRSGTVLTALRSAELPPSVVIAASHPGGEGIAVAEELAREGFVVTLVADAAMASMLTEAHVDVVLLGADTVLRTGAVVNKVGTHVAALAARQERIPCYVVAASDKVSHADEVLLEQGPPSSLYPGEALVEVLNPLFEVTPAKLISGIITEFGILAPDDMRDLAFEMKALAEW